MGVFAGRHASVCPDNTQRMGESKVDHIAAFLKSQYYGAFFWLLSEMLL